MIIIFIAIKMRCYRSIRKRHHIIQKVSMRNRRIVWSLDDTFKIARMQFNRIVKNIRVDDITSRRLDHRSSHAVSIDLTRIEGTVLKYDKGLPRIAEIVIDEPTIFYSGRICLDSRVVVFYIIESTVLQQSSVDFRKYRYHWILQYIIFCNDNLLTGVNIESVPFWRKLRRSWILSWCS